MQSLTTRPTSKGLITFVDATPSPEGNTSGLKPYGRNILIRMDEVYRREEGELGVRYPDSVIFELNQSSASGCIVAMGAEAFARYENGLTWTGDKPKVGDRVEVVIYSGKPAGGADGHVYRIMDCNCVMAGIDWTPPPEAFQ